MKISTIDKLRALHEEVCNSWRRQADPGISEAEADVLNTGFLALEMLYERWIDEGFPNIVAWHGIGAQLRDWLNRVHSQFDCDADIRITEVPHNE